MSATTLDVNTLDVCKEGEGPSVLATKTNPSSYIPLQGLVAVAVALTHGANLQEYNR